jgi:hypothetical protein
LLKSSKKKGLVLLLTLALGGCASSGNRDYDSMTPVENEHSPLAATLLAIFPGIFVHGLGNMYAGRQERGNELLEQEGLGVGCLAIGAGLGGLGYLSHVTADREKNQMIQIFDRIGEASSFIGCAGFTLFGVISFFDSWIHDMIEAGSAARDRNYELRRQLDRSPTIPPDVADLTTAGAPSGTHNLEIPH